MTQYIIASIHSVNLVFQKSIQNIAHVMGPAPNIRLMMTKIVIAVNAAVEIIYL